MYKRQVADAEGLGGADGETDAFGLGEVPGPAEGLPLGAWPASGVAAGEGSGVTGCAVRNVTPTAAGSVMLFCVESVDLMPYLSCRSRRYCPAMSFSKAARSFGPSPIAWML